MDEDRIAPAVPEQPAAATDDEYPLQDGTHAPADYGSMIEEHTDALRSWTREWINGSPLMCRDHWRTALAITADAMDVPEPTGESIQALSDRLVMAGLDVAWHMALLTASGARAGRTDGDAYYRTSVHMGNFVLGPVIARMIDPQPLTPELIWSSRAVIVECIGPEWINLIAGADAAMNGMGFTAVDVRALLGE